MKMSTNGLHALASFEGVSRFAYHDVAGFLTIGVGHLLTKAELTSSAIQIEGSYVSWRSGLSDDQCYALLAQDVYIFEQAVNGICSDVQLAQHEFDALVCLAYNIGGMALRNSSVIRLLKANDRKGAADAFLMWKKAGGRVVRGLLKRRESERKMFLNGIY